MTLPTLASLPSGKITLRDARRGTSREVTLEAFEIAIYPLHNTDVRLPKAPVTWLDAISLCNQLSRLDGRQVAYTYEADGHGVIWDTSADGYRIPTEAEWEYACRAGTTSATYGPLEVTAWTNLDGVDGPQPVGQKQGNPWGLYDTLGNVWEWCWDYADPARYGNYRTLRGGGWADEPWSVRASVRRGSAPDAVLEDVGLRVARGPVGAVGEAQGWSHQADRERAAIRGPLPVGWTPLRDILTNERQPPSTTDPRKATP